MVLKEPQLELDRRLRGIGSPAFVLGNRSPWSLRGWVGNREGLELRTEGTGLLRFPANPDPESGV